MKKEKETGEKRKNKAEVLRAFAAAALVIILAAAFGYSAYAIPDGPSEAIVISNETKTATAPYEFNVTGGYIYTINLTAVVQNPRWKAFIGNVSGKFTLEDSSGSAIFDWSLASISGEVYATRNSSSLNWAAIACASTANLESENTAMGHSGAEDNITATFSSGDHPELFVGGQQIAQDSCDHVLNTYVNSDPQTSVFFEIALNTESNIVYATIIEQSEAGFDGRPYDFQMIVPEIGTPGFSGATAYYLYVELE
jgi:hypothetical protein